MKLLLEGGLLWVSLSVEFRGNRLALNKVLLDTGSAGCVFNADRLSEIGVFVEPTDKRSTELTPKSGSYSRRGRR